MHTLNKHLLTLGWVNSIAYIKFSRLRLVCLQITNQIFPELLPIIPGVCLYSILYKTSFIALQN